jgi:tetratricopeptide (TPR) repeat protein
METNDWNDAERRVERAQELFEQRKWLEALDELRAATSINPYNASWFFNIGLTLDELGRYEEAIGAYQQALQIEPDDRQALHHLGLDLHQVGRFHDAIRTFERLEGLDPAFEPSYCGRILTFSELGEHERAEEMFYLARLYKEHCDDCYYNMGISLAARGQYDKAIFCFKKTLDGADDWPDVQFRLAKSYHLKGDLEQARRHYVLGLRQDPGNVDSLLDLSELLIEMKRLDEAGEKIRRAIELAPEQPAAHCCHGRWLLGAQRIGEAIAALTRALELDPTCPGAHLHLGAAHLRLGELETAKRHLRGELLLRPEDPTALRKLGNLLLDSGETRAAVACFKRLTQIRCDDVAAWLNLGVSQFLRARYDDGIACCEQALRLDPRNVMAYHNLALAYGQMREFDEAISFARRGLKIAPRDAALQRLDFRLRVLRLRELFVRALRRIIRPRRLR